MADPDPQDELRTLHARVDADAGAVAAHHGERLVCRRGCSACCVDELTVFEVEAERIRRNAPEVLREAPHPPGACAFLDAAGACRIYAHRPYVCRTQGLPLRWFSEDADEEIVEERSICELNLEGPPLDSLDDDAVWTIGPTELELSQLQQRAHGNQERVPLRSLFRGS